MASKFSPLPAVGDIVWCKFPQFAGKPGPKSRPALVVEVSEQEHVVLVAYGTTQKTEKIYPSEFLIDQIDEGFEISGLSYSTKFDFNQSAKLPFDSDWFENSPGPSSAVQGPILGVLHPSYYVVAKAAWERKKK